MIYPGFIEIEATMQSRNVPLFRSECMDKIGWTKSTYYHRRKGGSPFKKTEIPIFQKIAAKYGIKVNINNKELVFSR